MKKSIVNKGLWLLTSFVLIISMSGCVSSSYIAKEKPYPMISGLNYNMTPDEVFKALNAKESDAELTAQGNMDIYYLRNIKLAGHKFYGISLYFYNEAASQKAGVTLGLQSFYLLSDDEEQQKTINNELESGHFHNLTVTKYACSKTTREYATGKKLLEQYTACYEKLNGLYNNEEPTKTQMMNAMLDDYSGVCSYYSAKNNTMIKEKEGLAYYAFSGENIAVINALAKDKTSKPRCGI